MDIDAFAAEMRASLDRFVAHWKEQNKLDPEHWPLDGMNEAEWFEHFTIFDESAS